MRDRLRILSSALASLLLSAALAACTPTSQPAPSADSSGADLTITSRDMAFDLGRIAVAADHPFSLRLVNQDAAPHNVAIFVDSSAAESRFIGELVTSSIVVYEVPALPAGTYFFRCDLHPEMNGTLAVEG
jgi:plastocyanin